MLRIDRVFKQSQVSELEGVLGEGEFVRSIVVGKVQVARDGGSWYREVVASSVGKLDGQFSCFEWLTFSDFCLFACCRDIFC